MGSLPPGHPTSPQHLRGTDCRLPVSLAHLSSLRRVRDSPFGSSGDRGPEQLGGSPGPGASGHCLPSSARCPGALGWLCYAWKTIIRLEKNSPKCPESSLSAALLVAFISLLLFHIFHTFPCSGHSSESRRGPPNTGKLGTGSVYLRWSERASQRARNKRTAGPDPRGGERPAARAGATRFAAEDSAAWLKPAAPAGPRRRRARGAQRCRRVGGLKPAGRRSPGAANKDLCSAGLRPRVFQPGTGHGGQPGSSEKEPDKRVHI